jgi:hypothetical protein
MYLPLINRGGVEHRYATIDHYLAARLLTLPMQAHMHCSRLSLWVVRIHSRLRCSKTEPFYVTLALARKPAIVKPSGNRMLTLQNQLLTVLYYPTLWHTQYYVKPFSEATKNYLQVCTDYIALTFDPATAIQNGLRCLSVGAHLWGSS